MGHADQIYQGGNILTMDANMLNAEAIAIKDGRILAIGLGSGGFEPCRPLHQNDEFIWSIRDAGPS